MTTSAPNGTVPPPAPLHEAAETNHSHSLPEDLAAVADSAGAARPEAAGDALPDVVNEEVAEVQPYNAAASASAAESLPPDDDALRLLTELLVGGVLEGSDELVRRLRVYQQQLAEAPQLESAGGDETEVDRLRYALVGFIIESQARVRRTIPLIARLVDMSLDASGRVTRPIRNSFIGRPLQSRYDYLTALGEESLARWVNIGRRTEPESRRLARMTYREIIDEFISDLSQNPELQSVVQQQSLSFAGEVRDEVRERTVSADNVLEDIVRRVLRRPPREELAAPPPEVKDWAGRTLRDLQQTDEES